MSLRSISGPFTKEPDYAAFTAASLTWPVKVSFTGKVQLASTKANLGASGPADPGMIAIRDVPGDGDVHNVIEQPARSASGSERNSIVYEPRDSTNVIVVPVRGMPVRPGSVRHFKGKITANIFITNARIAWASTSYDKGGGWRARLRRVSPVRRRRRLPLDPAPTSGHLDPTGSWDAAACGDCSVGPWR
jgi:hypothetical protein